MSPYLLLLILWVLYFCLHSLFVRPWMKQKVKRLFPWLMPHYRLFYSLGATAGLVGILFYNAIVSHDRLLPPSGLSRYLGLMLATLGVIVLRLAFRVYSFRAFIGLVPVTDHTADGDVLHTSGILAKVRHPVYLGILLLTVGFWLYIPTVANLITAVVITSYLFVGIYLEEQDLERQFGEEYRQYRQKVPMLLPYKRRNRRGDN